VQVNQLNDLLQQSDETHHTKHTPPHTVNLH